MTPGQAHDLVGAEALLARVFTPRKLLADRVADRGRNVVARMFCRLKDFRRIATR